MSIDAVAEALFYAARRDDWGVANEDEREEFYDLARAAIPMVRAQVAEELRSFDPQDVIIARWVAGEIVPINERCPEGEGRAIRWALDLAATETEK